MCLLLSTTVRFDVGERLSISQEIKTKASRFYSFVSGTHCILLHHLVENCWAKEMGKLTNMGVPPPPRVNIYKGPLQKMNSQTMYYVIAVSGWGIHPMDDNG